MMKKLLVLFVFLMAIDASANESTETIVIGEIQPTLCVYEGPLAKQGEGCEMVMLEIDKKSPTGYAIPKDLRSAFRALNRIVSYRMAEKLTAIYREEGDKRSCLKDEPCARWVKSDLGEIIRDAWAIEQCSVLATDLISHGVNPTKWIADPILIAYRDMIIAPETDGIFTRFLRTEEKEPSIAMVYKFLIDRGYVLSPGDNPCGDTTRK